MVSRRLTTGASEQRVMLSQPKISGNLFIKKGVGTLYDNYQVGKTLGKGTFGEVFLCTHYDTKDLRAVKWVNKDLLNKDSHAQIINEINILRSLDHPNIVRIYEYFDDAQFLYIVMEYIQGGALLKEITKRGRFTERDASIIIH